MQSTPGTAAYDNGASYEGRLEKDDNLRLALAVRDELIRLGQDVVMTRDTDVFVPLDEARQYRQQRGSRPVHLPAPELLP